VERVGVGDGAVNGMKIGFVTTTSLESPYGIGRCYPLAKYLARAGHEVHIIALHHNWTLAVLRYQLREGVHVHHVGQMHVRKVGNTTIHFSLPALLWTVSRGLSALTRKVLELKPDIIHIGKPHPQNSIAGFIAGKAMPDRRIFLDYDDYEAGINRFGNAVERYVIRLFENRVPRYVAGVTTHSSYLQHRLVQGGVSENRILRLPSGFDPERFRRRPDDLIDALRSELGLAEKQVILYVGTLSFTSHAIDLLLKAFARVANRHADAILVLAGGGVDLEQAKHLAEGLGIGARCRFLGRVPGEQVPLLLQMATLSVDPVRATETEKARWPLKIVESLAAGVPVLTGEIGDRSEMLGDGEAGLLVTPDSTEALARGIDQALASPQALNTMAGCAKRLSARYDARRLARKLVKFYQAFEIPDTQPV